MKLVLRWLTLRVCLCCCASISTTNGALAAPSSRVEALPTYDSPSLQLTPYVLNGAGLAFSYPRGWKVNERPDADSLVKISGTGADGMGAEFAVGMHQISPGLTKETFATMFEETAIGKLPGYKKVDEKRVSFGQQRAFEGVLEDFSFDANGTRVTQRLVTTSADDRIYTFAFTCSGTQFEKLMPLCDQILATMKRDGGSGRTARAVGAQPQAIAWESFHSASVPFSLSYPSGWRLEETGEKDHPLKIAGTDRVGRFAGVDVHCGDLHPAASLEMLADGLEGKYFTDLKNYKRGKRESTNFGRSSNLQGLYQEISFEKDGHPAKQLSVFFRNGDRCYMLSMTAMGWTDNEMESVFHKMLATVATNE